MGELTHTHTTTILIPLAIVFSNSIKNDFVLDLMWVIGFFGLLNFCFYLHQKGTSFTLFNKLKWLGNCSYTFSNSCIYEWNAFKFLRQNASKSNIHLFIGCDNFRNFIFGSFTSRKTIY